MALREDGFVWVTDPSKPPDGSAYVFRPRIVDPVAQISGTCPGTIEVRTEDLTPRGFGSLYASSQPGNAILDSGHCTGTEVGLAAPLLLLGEGKIDPEGVDLTTLSADASDCGYYVQTVDLTSCAVSNVVQVP